MKKYKKLIGVKMTEEMYDTLVAIAYKAQITVPHLIRKAMKRVIKAVG